MIKSLIMTKFCPLFLVLAASALPASVTTFSDPAAFLAAAAAIHGAHVEQADLSGTKLNLPQVSLQDYSNWPQYDHLGHPKPLDDPQLGYKADVTKVENGQLEGCIGHACGQIMNVSTVWTFSRPLRAFGATFAYPEPQRQSAGIQTGVTNFTFQDGFFGFVSDDPVTTFTFLQRDVINPDPNFCPSCPPPTTRYTITGLSAALEDGSATLVPESDTLPLCLVTLVFGGLWFVFKKNFA